ncbi:MBL fold metallo-hydrolase [Clostridium botulinum]|uniref:MBL fold metallo-hydrolase n=1 Tax=Clostridium botulinum TaxID=1491 RepID=A0A6G4HQA7_CLOBO|nr:MBL fold metallo-hydrolase [Clostridium botulinum]MBO0572778.1 MBL fold metallo-hydrolase [Clostridium botulinum]NFJ61693.1 MBL fold metallo-hydrolase [Clostridium botulinum]NFQ62448.1 MBL fold metallo-hydrolase [Clostridium botulinum]NFR19256.1 MBL fold metallo-hydrolase [Clostridium botulinum]NFU18268.1 MBL fold metallo-hydrolase [Clostridium botulinum]
MKLKVLGSGSAGNCYLLQGEEETLIIECGLSYKTILKGLNFNLGNVMGCLVSHEHKDHSKAVQDLIKNGIDVYSSKGTFEAIEVKGHRTNIIESEKSFKIGEFVVLPFKTQHDAVEPLGFLIYQKEIGNLLFITDSYYCQYKFQDVDHILIECNYSNEILEEKELSKTLKNRIIKSHFELENVKEFLKATDLKETKEIVLIHLSDGNSNATQFHKEIERLTGKPTYIADKGLELELEV